MYLNYHLKGPKTDGNIQPNTHNPQNMFLSQKHNYFVFFPYSENHMLINFVKQAATSAPDNNEESRPIWKYTPTVLFPFTPNKDISGTFHME